MFFYKSEFFTEIQKKTEKRPGRPVMLLVYIMRPGPAAAVMPRQAFCPYLFIFRLWFISFSKLVIVRAIDVRAEIFVVTVCISRRSVIESHHIDIVSGCIHISYRADSHMRARAFIKSLYSCRIGDDIDTFSLLRYLIERIALRSILRYGASVFDIADNSKAPVRRIVLYRSSVSVCFNSTFI